MEQKKKFNKFLYFAVFAGNIGGFAVGAAFAWPSPMVPRLNGQIDAKNNPLPEAITAFEESWITSLNPLGAALGPFLFGFLADVIGRKKTLLLSMLPMAIAYITCAFSHSVGLFYFARFINGIGAGGVYCVIPMYVGEISQDSNRGAMGCVFTVFIAIGNLFSYGVGPYLSVMYFNLVSLIAPLLFLAIFSLLIPESPYYYLSKNMKGDAEKSLRWLRTEDDIECDKELQIMQKTLDESCHNEDLLAILKVKCLRKALGITVFLAVIQEFTGIDIILSYMQSVFGVAGGKLSAEHSSIVVGLIQVFACIFTSVVVDRLGRRLLLLLSLVGSAISLISIGVFFRMQDDGDDVTVIHFLPITSLIVFVIAYNLGIGTVPYALIGELFPQNVKSTASTVTVFCNLILAFTTTNVFPYLIDLMGMGESFWLFGSCCFVGFVFVFFVVPETKGQSFSAIQKILSGAV